MALRFNPFTGKLDYIGLTQTDADALYVKIPGDTMTGDLTFPVSGFIMTDSNGVHWRVTINTSGALVTTMIVGGGAIGLLLALTYSN